LVAEEKGMKSFIGSLSPAHHQEFTVGLVEKIQKKMGLWILGQIIVSFVMFITTWAGLLILHVPYALILGVIAGLLEVIPYIGPFLSAVPAIFIALLQSPASAFAVVVLYLLLHELEGYILVPKIMEKTIGTSSLAILIALLVGFKLAGVVGLVISIPIAAAITVTINEFWPGKTI
jgi:predicted PurR-regulated permease PerM